MIKSLLTRLNGLTKSTQVPDELEVVYTMPHEERVRCTLLAVRNLLDQLCTDLTEENAQDTLETAYSVIRTALMEIVALHMQK